MTDRDPFRITMTGPLAPFAHDFCTQLIRRGYTSRSAADQVYLMAHLSRWLQEQGLSVAGLTSKIAQDFLDARRGSGCSRRTSATALTVLLGFLRDRGVLPPVATAPGAPATDAVLEPYRRYLLCERGLTPATVARYLRTAGVFLGQRPGPAGGLELLTAGQVTAFVLGACRGRTGGSAKVMTTELRSFLRFVHGQGLIPVSLTGAVPPVAGWKHTALPRTLTADQVTRLLAGCDLGTAMGRRDYAILMLLARLGLRAGEVAALQVDDIGWRAGEVMIRGKGNRIDRLPLPVDVGQAMAGYLAKARPPDPSRRLFCTVVAPTRPLSPSAVTQVVARCCAKAGVPRVFAHRLRHFAATQMLQHGAALSEIAQVLRHRDPATTAI